MYRPSPPIGVEVGQVRELIEAVVAIVGTHGLGAIRGATLNLGSPSAVLVSAIS